MRHVALGAALLFGTRAALAQGGARTTATLEPLTSRPSITIRSGLTSRSPALHDPQFAIRAMQLTPAQQQALAAIRARFAPTVSAIVARLNGLVQQHAAATALAATEDTLRHLLGAEHAAADSVITPTQRQAFVQALRQIHGAATPGGANSTGARTSSVAAPVAATEGVLPDRHTAQASTVAVRGHW